MNHSRILNVVLIASLAVLSFAAYHSLRNSWAFGRVRINDNGHARVIDFSDLQSQPVVDMWTRTSRPIRRPGINTLVIFLSGAECAKGLDEFATWKELVRTIPKTELETAIILIRVSSEEAKAVSEDLGHDIGLYWDSSGTLPTRIQLPQSTPFKVLLDGNGRVLLVDGPEGDKSGQEDFARTVRTVLAKHAGVVQRKS